jgi:phosphoribosyl 1,2-cyclic phosphodiesterase
MRFCSLGSGSSGNATLVEASDGTTVTRVLVDCGFSLRELTLRLARVGLAPQDIDAVFVTHEHGDHVGCALSLARKQGCALWMSHGTWRAIGEPDLPAIRHARDGEVIAVGDLQLTPFTVPHDANEPLQLRFTDGQSTLGVLTDLGCVTPHVLAHLQRCDALLLEFNHDRELLARSAYPESLKRRISGRLGHLANDLSAALLRDCLHPGLRHVVAAHLSAQNNQPSLVRQLLADTTGANADEFLVADPDAGFDWLALK